jgi:CO/xanthine dehydrogenase FAD-binding subunit
MCSDCAGKLDTRVKDLRIALRTICRMPWKAFDLAEEALNADDRRI